jgi:hypothetical protein
MTKPLRQFAEPPTGAPPWVPLGWFGSALAWLILAALGLYRIAPDLVAGNLYSPRVFAVTHALTLGVLTSAVLGALHQFIPVVMGVPIRHPRVAIAGFWLSQTGTSLLVYALWHWNLKLQLVAWIIFFAAVGAGSWSVLPARRRATQNRYVGVFVSVGHSALGLAMFLALARIGHGLGWWEVSRDGLLVAHLHLGLVGFGTLTAVGFGSKMIPAFLRSSAAPEPARFNRIAGLAAVGLIVFSAGAIWNGSWLVWIGGFLLLLSVVQHLAVIVGYWKSQTVPRLDPALGFIGAAVLWYAVAAGLGVWLLVTRPPGGPIWAAYVLAFLLGWLIHLILGVLHRIGPRLTANLLALRGKPLPTWLARAELPWPALSWLALAGMTGGSIALVGSLMLLGHAVVARWGAVLLLAGVLALAVQAAALWYARRGPGA